MKNGIVIYLNEKEKALLENLSQRTKLSKSAYLRECINNQGYLKERNNFILFLQTNEELLKYLKSIATNINQIAYVLNSGIERNNDDLVQEIILLKAILKDYQAFLKGHIKPKLYKRTSNG